MNIHQRKLANIHSAYIGGHKYARAVRQLHQEGKFQLVDTKHHVDWPQYEFNDEKAISTYDACVELNVVSLMGKDFIHLEIWEGENLRGHPIKKQSTYTFEGPWWLIEGLVYRVNADFDQHCFSILKQREDAERAKQAFNIGLDLLAKIPGPLTEA